MKKVLIVLSLILIALFIVPFLIPIPDLEEIMSIDELKTDESNFIDINGVQIHYYDQGEGEKTYILLHGFGASVFSFREIIPYLSENSRVIVFDRPAFGLTERLTEWDMFNPYTPEGQIEITVGLMDELGIEKATLIGHSAGGLIALNTYLEYPERVSELILIAPAIYEVSMFSEYIQPLFKVPQVNRLGPLLVRRIGKNGEEVLKNAWFDESKITQDIYDGYKKPLQAENWDIALWNLTKYTYSLRPEDRLNEVNIPVLIITGDSDTIVRVDNSVMLRNEIDNAKIEIIDNCGHVPHEECYEEFLNILIDLKTEKE